MKSKRWGAVEAIDISHTRVCGAVNSRPMRRPDNDGVAADSHTGAVLVARRAKTKRGLESCLLGPDRSVPGEDIRRAAVVISIGTGSILAARPDDNRVAFDGDSGIAEDVIRLAVARHQFLLLAP